MSSSESSRSAREFHGQTTEARSGSWAVTYLLDRDDLLGLVMDSLVHSAEAAGAEFLQERILAGGVIAGYRVWF